MARTLFDSPHIFGIHEPGGERYMLEAGKPGWIVFTEELGSDPNDQRGGNYTHWSNQGLGVICRLNHGYERGGNAAGAIPHSSRYADFARRCANFVANSQGCKIWIIGNEPNHPVEWPGARLDHSRRVGRGQADSTFLGREVKSAEDDGQARPTHPSSAGHELREYFMADRPPSRSRWILLDPGEQTTPQRYAQCYRQCREAIHHVPGHEDDQVLVGGVAPWIAMVKYPGNDTGDWVIYLEDILKALGPANCDGVTLHTYTHGPSPDLIHSSEKMTSFPQRYYHFLAYREFMQAIPANMRRLPVYITETNHLWHIREANTGWADQNSGWVQRAYAEIEWWNQQPGHQQIRALVLYRWPHLDSWVIEGKNGVIEDFRQALKQDYRWREMAAPPPAPPPTPADFKGGDRVYTAGAANLRQAAGIQEKRLAEIPGDTVCTIISGPLIVDNLVWWRVQCTVGNEFYSGWMAQATPSGKSLVTRAKPPTPQPPQETKPPQTDAPQPPTPAPAPRPAVIEVGGLVAARQEVAVRNMAGYKSAKSRKQGDMPVGAQATIIGGPQTADGLTWWQVRMSKPDGSPLEGWSAQTSAAGAVLLEALALELEVPPLPPQAEAPAAAATIHGGGRVQANEEINLRHTPGWRGKKNAVDVVYAMPGGAEGQVIAGPQEKDGLTWWQVRTVTPGNEVKLGWGAHLAADGRPLLIALPDKADLAPSKPAEEAQPGKFRLGDLVYTQAKVNLRRSPGTARKGEQDILAVLPLNAQVRLISGPQAADSLTWWRGQYVSPQRELFDGWLAEAQSGGQALLALSPAPAELSQKSKKTFAIGDAVCNLSPDAVNVRGTPGTQASDQVVAQLPSKALAAIVDGPQQADGLTWWKIDGAVDGAQIEGWVAEVGPKGTRFLAPAQFLDLIRLGKPFEGRGSVTQRFGERPEVYAKFNNKGHNGIDFALKNGTPVLTTDDGKVLAVDYQAGGFGNYVKVEHIWGESVYAHLKEASVKPGDAVKRGEKLGLSDNTGNSSGPHLHFCIRIFPYQYGDGWSGYCDPAPFMNPNDLASRGPADGPQILSICVAEDEPGSLAP